VSKLTLEIFSMKSRYIAKKQWVELFQAIDLSEEKMQQWHQEFEKRYPEGHQEFLQWIGISTEEISRVRAL
jgi:hypothetical protein